MLIPLPVTGDWVQISARCPVLRVQIADDKTGVHIVTSDGAQMTVPVSPPDDPARVRDAIADQINQARFALD